MCIFAVMLNLHFQNGDSDDSFENKKNSLKEVDKVKKEMDEIFLSQQTRE